ncbi:MAG TPA: hypothetical protein VND65_18285 [Candidatus Binatia bacterium]|nr:hypothetical protein [Candidatus Binatia bacterium]
MIVAIIAFLLGSVCHTLAQVDAAARGRKLSGWPARWAIIQDAAIPIFVRTLITLAIFALWPEGQAVSALNAIKVPIPDWVDAILDLHVTWPVAFLVGIVLDVALGFIPKFRSVLPADPLANGNAAAQKPS